MIFDKSIGQWYFFKQISKFLIGWSHKNLYCIRVGLPDDTPHDGLHAKNKNDHLSILP